VGGVGPDPLGIGNTQTLRFARYREGENFFSFAPSFLREGGPQIRPYGRFEVGVLFAVAFGLAGAFLGLNVGLLDKLLYITLSKQR